jgi:hypothetical protein
MGAQQVMQAGGERRHLPALAPGHGRGQCIAGKLGRGAGRMASIPVHLLEHDGSLVMGRARVGGQCTDITLFFKCWLSIIDFEKQQDSSWLSCGGGRKSFHPVQRKAKLFPCPARGAAKMSQCIGAHLAVRKTSHKPLQHGMHRTHARSELQCFSVSSSTALPSLRWHQGCGIVEGGCSVLLSRGKHRLASTRTSSWV